MTEKNPPPQGTIFSVMLSRTWIAAARASQPPSSNLPRRARAWRCPLIAIMALFMPMTTGWTCDLDGTGTQPDCGTAAVCGDATFVGGYLQLTPNAGNKNGHIQLPPLLLPTFDVRLDYYFSSASGADGVGITYRPCGTAARPVAGDLPPRP